LLSKHETLACRVRCTMESFRCTDHRALRLMEPELGVSAASPHPSQSILLTRYTGTDCTLPCIWARWKTIGVFGPSLHLRFYRRSRASVCNDVGNSRARRWTCFWYFLHFRLRWEYIRKMLQKMKRAKRRERHFCIIVIIFTAKFFTEFLRPKS